MGVLQLGCSDDAASDAQSSAGLLSDAKTLATMERGITAAGLDCQAFVPYTAALARTKRAAGPGPSRRART